jgi:hypothetical protein
MKTMFLVLMSTFILTNETFAQGNATAREREFFPTCTPSLVSFRTTNQDCGERFITFIKDNGFITYKDPDDTETSIFYFKECEHTYIVKVGCDVNPNYFIIEEDGRKSDKTLEDIQAMIAYYLKADQGIEPVTNGAIGDKIQYQSLCL